MEWPFNEAVAKVCTMLHLGTSPQQANAKREISLAVGDRTDNFVPQERKDLTIRQLQQNADNDVSEHTLMQALVYFYLEIQRISVAELPDPDAKLETAQQLLDYLVEERQITNRESHTALFYYLVENCSEKIVSIERDHILVRDAVAAALATGRISRPQANIATFCLLAVGSPSQARCEGAEEDLPGALPKVLGKKINRIEGSAKYIEALLFPLEFSDEANVKIRRELTASEYAGNTAVMAREAYLKEYFKTKTGCTGYREVKSYLTEAGWLMEVAIRAYRSKQFESRPSKATETSFTAPAPAADEETPTLVQEVRTMAMAYHASLPSQTTRDHGFNHLIRQFLGSHFNNKEDHIRIVQCQLAFRKAVCEKATRIVKQMFPYKTSAAIDEWIPHESIKERDRMNHLTVFLMRYTDWLKPKRGEDGSSYSKPYWYIAQAMVLHSVSDAYALWLMGEVEGV